MNEQIVKDILAKPTELSEDQRLAVLTTSRFCRIIAGAGAGKTETLTRRIVYLLLAKGVQPSSIVAFTFTEKASLSMKNRIYERVEHIGGEKATANLGEMYIGTIHGYANRILEDRFGFGNYEVFDDNQEMAYLLREGWGLGLDSAGGYANNCADFLRSINMIWGEMIDEKPLKKKAPDFYGKLKSYESLLDTHKRLTFGKMIHTLVLKLRASPDALKGVKYLIVDEYQDINRAQAELIQLIGKNSEVFVVGDPRQSIYQWRGSDEKFFQEFSNTFRDPDKISIRENRRSLESIVKVANEFADTFKKTKYEHLEWVKKDTGFVGLSNHEDAESEAEWIATQIETLKELNGSNYSDFGILLRSVNTSAPPLLEVFRERNIPFIVGGKVGLFKREEAQALGRIISWLSDDGFWIENPWKWNEKIEGDDLLHTGLHYWLQSHLPGNPSDAIDKLEKLKIDLQKSTSTVRNFTQILRYILNSLGFMNLDPDNPNDAAVMANLGRFSTLLTDYETANRIGGRTPHWNKDLKGLCWFMNSYASLSYEEQPSDDIRGVNAVQIMTVHQAKGLEWSVVFLPALVKQRFPSSMVGREQNWCGIPRSLFDVKRYEGDEEDERRLFYVAITRAKDALVMSYFKKYKNAESVSPFVSEIDKDLYTTIKIGQNLPKLKLNATSDSIEMQSVSAGEIITYERCPHMYRLGQIWGYKPGLNEAIGYGNSLHFCLRRAAELVKNEGYSPKSAIATSVEEGFHIPFAGGSVFENFKKGAKRVLSEFSNKHGDDLKRIDEVEYRLEFPRKSVV